MLPEAAGDSLRAALDSAFAAPAYRWETAADPFGPIRRAWQHLLGWFDRLRHTNPGALHVLTWFLVGVLVAVLLHAAWIAWVTVREGSRSVTRERGERAGSTRDAAWYRAEADRFAADGRFAEAMQADFLRLMLELDARRVTRFHPSRTPNEYVRTAALPDDQRRDLAQLVRSLYAYAFARVPCDASSFADFRMRANANRYAPA